MIDDELRPAVIEFVIEMLNDPHCESILLDAGDDARVDSNLPVLYLNITGKRRGYTLSILGCKYSGRIQNIDTYETIMTMEGEREAWGLRKLLDDFRTRLQEES